MRVPATAELGWYRLWGKRALDIVVGGCALLVFSPVIALIAFTIWVVDGSPVLFIQPRPGLNEHIFGMLKFRTMTDARDQNGELLPDDRRATRLGKFLRSTSLDELPELWNVLTGDMSLVGPRPLLVEYLPHYSPEQHRRHDVRPGLTGLAQVHGRNQTTWDKRWAWDLCYVETFNLSLDARILAQTLIVILRSDGGLEATAALGKFRGNDRATRSSEERGGPGQ